MTNLVLLKEILRDRMSHQDFLSICFDLDGVDYENLQGDSKLLKVQSFITFLDNRGKVHHAEYWIRKNRPDIDLTSIEVSQSDALAIRQTELANSPQSSFYSCSFSFSEKDKDFARKLYVDLTKRGLSCWFPEVDLLFGENLRTALDIAIKNQGRLIIILSQEAVTNTRVEQAFETAVRLEEEEDRHILVPIRIDEAPLLSQTGWCGYLRNTRLIGDFSNHIDDVSYINNLVRLEKSLAVRPN